MLSTTLEKLKDYVKRDKDAVIRQYDCFDKIPACDRIAILEAIPQNEYTVEHLMYLVESLADNDEGELAIPIIKYYRNQGLINNFQLGGLEAIAESEMRPTTAFRLKTYEKALEWLTAPSDSFAMLLKEHCEANKHVKNKVPRAMQAMVKPPFLR